MSNRPGMYAAHLQDLSEPNIETSKVIHFFDDYDSTFFWEVEEWDTLFVDADGTQHECPIPKNVFAVVYKRQTDTEQASMLMDTFTVRGGYVCGVWHDPDQIATWIAEIEAAEETGAEEE